MRNPKPAIKKLKRAGCHTLLVLVLLFACFLVFDYTHPLPEAGRIQSTIILADNETPLRAFADPKGVWRYPVNLHEVSPLYLHALLTYEDRWFYYHFGINPLALLRAAWQWVNSGRIVSGGSTLTMQVARIIDPHQRSVSGKLWQMLRALQLEWHYSKDDILKFYLNLAPFGGPIEGVQTASYAYLHKPATHLSHAEAALLAVLPQAPSRLRPDRYPKRARYYRDKVLQRMKKLSNWSHAIVQDALMEPVIKRRLRQPMTAPLFSRLMKERAHSVAKRTPEGGARIKTSLDIEIQWLVEHIVKVSLGRLPETTSSAILVMENSTGLIKAYLGSADFLSVRRSGHVDMVQAIRSPGSTLKPFLYGMALDQGLIHSASLLSDAPLKLHGYAPQNFLGDYRGAVTAAEALRLSLNVPAVTLLQHINPVTFDARLRHAGFALHYPADSQANLSLILGGVGTRLFDLTRGFSALARNGISIKPRYTLRDPIIERHFLSASSSWIIGKLLRDVPAPNGFSNHQLQISWKTGTSYGFRDAWSVGVNSRYTVGVWLGRPDGTPLPGQYGALTAGPLLFKVFQALPAPTRYQKRPSQVSQQTVCWPLGGLLEDTPKPHCHHQHVAWVIDKQIPSTLPHLSKPSWSARLQHFWVNPRTGKRVNMHCLKTEKTPKSIAHWPLEVKPWLDHHTLSRLQIPGFDSACPNRLIAHQTQRLNITDLDNSTQLALPINGKGLRFKLKAQGGTGTYLWLVNDSPVGTDTQHNGFPYHFKDPGYYDVVVIDEMANLDRIRIRLIE